MKVQLAARMLLIAAAVAAVATNRKAPDLGTYERISSDPDYTHSFAYISPGEAEPRFARAAAGKKNAAAETDSYKAFLDKYFSDSTANRPDYGGERAQRLRDNRDDSERIDGNSREYDDRFHDTEYERIKAVSKEQEKEIKKNPKHCKVTLKDGMQCSVCKNPKTGSHSESCSFSSTPPEKKYAYVKERNYNSKDHDKEEQKKAKEAEEDEDDGDDDDDDDDEDDDEEGDGADEKKSAASNTNEKKVRSTVVAPSAPPPTSSRPAPRNRGPPMAKQSPTPRTPVLRNNANRQPQRSQSIRASTTTAAPIQRRQFHSTYRITETRPKRRVVGLDPFLYGSHSSDDARPEQLRKRSPKDGADGHESDEEAISEGRDRTYEDYFAHVFPEAKNGRLSREDDHTNTDDVEFIPDYASKTNVEQVLAEFKKKDWSTCKKERRGDLTCYLCNDDHGVRHEECMFVSGAGSTSKQQPSPKSSRLAYSETKEYHHTPERASVEPKKLENLRADGANDGLHDGNGGDDDEEQAEDEDEVEATTKKPTKSKEKNKQTRTVVIRRRKSKQHRPEFDGTNADAASPDDAGEHQSAGTKKTIKRMVDGHHQQGGGASVPDNDDASKRRSMTYQHQIVHEV